jgi:hypothetical protein
LNYIDSTTLKILVCIGPHSDFLPHEFTCETPLSLVPKCYSIDSQSVVLFRGYSNHYREIIEVGPKKNNQLEFTSYEIELQENAEDILPIRRSPKSPCFLIIQRVDSVKEYNPINIPSEYHNGQLESITVRADKTINFTFSDGRTFSTRLEANRSRIPK